MSVLTLPADSWRARARVLRQAWPLVVASASTPLLGLADTAVLGRTGTSVHLGAVALGSLIFNFLYWSFGFLRMGTTGFVAQAAGRGDEGEVRAALFRALLVGTVLALLLLVLQTPIERAALGWLSGGVDVERLTSDYFRIRIWGAPAALGNLGLAGVLIGLGETRLLLWTQLFLNGLNVALDLLLAGFLGYGVSGVALGTAASQWASLVLTATLVLRLLLRRSGSAAAGFFRYRQVFSVGPLWHTLKANSNILIRTLFLLAGFAWFTEQGARFGADILAANHVLLQFVSLAAFFLDGYAHVAESLVGHALGSRERVAFDRALWRTTELATATGVALGAVFYLTSHWAIALLTSLPNVAQPAASQAALVAVYIALSPLAFQLDGVFIGATRGAALRNASAASFAAFWLASAVLVPRYENTGLWVAFVLYVGFRGVSLAVALPALRRAVSSGA